MHIMNAKAPGAGNFAVRLATPTLRPARLAGAYAASGSLYPELALRSNSP